MKLFVPITNNGSGDVKSGWAMCMITELSGCEVNIVGISDSHANRQCNKMASEFLKTDCDAMLIIDADITFTRHDIARLIGHYERGVKLVYGLYPKKQDSSDPCVCTFNEVPVPDEHGLVTLRRSGRGFLFVVREVFERLKEENNGPALRYHNHGDVQWDWFRSGPVIASYSALGAEDDEQGFPKREWLSEDWMFCEDCRLFLGIPCLVDTGISLGHIGPKEYRFHGEQITNIDASRVKSWRDIDGWFDYEEVYRRIVAEIPDGGRFVEVGCWMGKSIAAFAEFAKEAGKNIEMHVVDTFEGKPANARQEAILNVHGGNVDKMFLANMEALALRRNILAHRQDSVEAAEYFKNQSWLREPDAVFIDADHSEEAVYADITAWAPIVKKGGILAGHDIDERGVFAAVTRFFRTQYETIGRCWWVKM